MGRRGWTAALAALFLSVGFAVVHAAPPPSQTAYSCNLNAPNCLIQAFVASWFDSNVGYTRPTGNDYPLPVALPAGAQSVVQTGGDVCQNPAYLKASVALNISTATTTELVASSVGKTVYVCSLNFTSGGTTPTYTFKTGTKVSTPCDTTPANLTGALAPTSGTSLFLNPQGTMMQTISGGDLCVTTAGTNPVAVGFMTYVAQ